MKQITVALFAAFALSAAAFAGSVGYDTGTFVAGKMTGSFNSHLDIDITGSLNHINLDTGKLVKTSAGCAVGASCFHFMGGSVNIDNGKFKDTISGGVVISATGVATISAILAAEPGVISGGAVSTFDFSHKRVTFGSADVSVNTVPEPTALSLLGIAMIPLLGFGWRYVHDSQREC